RVGLKARGRKQYPETVVVHAGGSDLLLSGLDGKDLSGKFRVPSRQAVDILQIRQPQYFFQRLVHPYHFARFSVERENARVHQLEYLLQVLILRFLLLTDDLEGSVD